MTASPRRPTGWCAEDLDRLSDAPRHVELIDGALVPGAPRRAWHGRVGTHLTAALATQAPDGMTVEQEMTIRLDARNRPEPDLLVTTATYEPDRTWHAPEAVILVVEVVSPESAHRDRTVKRRKYADAGIPHYWRIENEDGVTVVHVDELDGPSGVYAPAGIFRGALSRPVPFPVTLDLNGLVRRPGQRTPHTRH